METVSSSSDPPPIVRPRKPPRAPQEEEGSSLLTLEDVMSSKEDLSLLPNRVIKMLLDSNCVSYVGVVEREDLIQRLEKLIENKILSEKKFAAEQEAAVRVQNESSSSLKNSAGSTVADEDENTCKICFEAPLNCVMLNCGHLSSCMDW
ncbi:hypothetical protein BGZ46_010148 [Entomortierella lignicola]|nr:hypothetical protein BGZ46_010148 [Entomortierella lignicola]